MSPLSPLATATPVSFEAVQVVCAWPVSGQYGPGSRVLYYILVAGAILGRKKLWLRHACLAVALVFPAVAAIHGIVLASTHVNGQYSALNGNRVVIQNRCTNPYRCR
jgi:hypothetical protein